MRFLKAEIYFPIIIGIHFLFWAIDLFNYQGDFSTRQVVGEVFSSWVVTVFAFNLLMATRARWVERIFGGLDKMYLIHRRSGVIAVVLLLLHFLIVPKTPEFQIGKPMGMYAMVLIILGVILSAAPLLKRKIKYHRWLNMHKTMGLFYTVGVAHALFVPTLISELPLIRIYVFGMAGIGILAWIYRAFLYGLFNKKLAYNVASVRNLPGAMVEASLQPAGAGLDFAAGQFAYFKFTGPARPEPHPFTISSHPSEPNLRVTVKALGDHTTELQKAIEQGAPVQVEGPFGHFTSDKIKSTRQIWIAGGIGITPFLALAREVDSKSDVSLFWCVKSEGEAAYTQELNELAGKNSAFSFTLWPSDVSGRISIKAIASEVDFTTVDFLICGPAGLKKSLIGELKSLGVKESQIHDEEFSFR